MKFIYFSLTGKSEATRASVPFHLAVNGSLEVGHEVAMILGGDAADIVAGDGVDTVEGIGLPPLRDLIKKLKEHQVPVYV